MAKRKRVAPEAGVLERILALRDTYLQAGVNKDALITAMRLFAFAHSDREHIFWGDPKRAPYPGIRKLKREELGEAPTLLSLYRFALGM